MRIRRCVLIWGVIVFSKKKSFAKKRSDGFVLPYVLVVIAILAVAGTIAATRLQNTTQTLSAVQAKTKTERMMEAAEATAVFALLGGNRVPGGYDVNPNSPVQTEFGPMGINGQRLDPKTAAAIPKDFWSAAGGLRRVDTPSGPVIVMLQDTTGLPSLTKPMARPLRNVLIYAGASPREVDDLAASLADYIDIDNKKRFGGAERSDYMLKKLPPPTNSPLRSYAELASINGWMDILPRLDQTRLKAMTTLQAVDYRTRFALPEHAQVLGLDSGSLLANNFDSVLDGSEMRNILPSGRMRLTFWAPRGDGQWDKRVIEFVRQTGHITNPYRRLWVLDATVLETELVFKPDQISDIAHVIDPASLRP